VNLGTPVTKPVEEHRVTKISKKRSVNTSEDDNIPQSEHELRVNHIDYYRVPKPKEEQNIIRQMDDSDTNK
jgi:hypothetical protein